MVESIIVRFQGDGAGVEELTWAQRSIWESMRAAGRSIAIGGMMPMPAGTKVEDLAHVLKFAMCRHQSLRTRLRFESDGRPLQVVSPSGEIALAVVDVPDDGDPAGMAEAIRDRQELGTFDYAHEWPVWMSVVRHRGAVTHMVAMYSHLAVDGHGLAALVQDLSNMDPSTGETTAPVDGIQPIDLARQQRMPAALRQSTAALSHWERVLRAIPPRRFGAGHGEPREPRFWELDCRSPALLLAVQAIARRTRANSGAVLLAAYAVAMTRVTGISPSVALIVVNNRFRPGFAASVSHLAQYSPVAIHVDGCTFDEVTARAGRAALAATKHAYYDAAACHELIARVGRERGERIDTACFFNDRRFESRDAPDGDVSPGAIRDALPHTVRRWGRRWDWYDGLFFLHINEAQGAIEYTAWADTHHLAPAGLESFVEQFEDVVVEAALDPAA